MLSASIDPVANVEMANDVGDIRLFSWPKRLVL